VLDVGVGLGYGMAIISVKASRVEGVDVDDKAVEYAAKEYVGKNPKIKSVKVYDGYKLPYPSKSFNVITCVDVLEHVEDYDRFIDELLRVTKKYVIFGTPNRRKEYTNPDGTPMNHWHLREWSKPELDAILKKHSAKIEWRLIDGPFDGPFTVNKRTSKNTLVLMPVLTKI
jgi:ubiquinone/menaquinone biosynthesis C-methylase UbiE